MIPVIFKGRFFEWIVEPVQVSPVTNPHASAGDAEEK